ncbi:MAG: hypothetical protein LJE70_20305 [Chromatiaceae bacterium]|nr:hypothetical protein [Chromatiaceae bacterium]
MHTPRWATSAPRPPPTAFRPGSSDIFDSASEKGRSAESPRAGELEQLKLSHKALEAMAPLSVTLRTMDAGGDKKLPYLPEHDSRPALGLRGIRFSLEHPEIFLTQLGAGLVAPSNGHSEASQAVMVQQHATTPGTAQP